MPMKPNNATVVDKCTQRITALTDHVQPSAIIAVNGSLHSATEVIGMFQQCIDDRARLAARRAEVQIELANRAQSEAMRRAVDRALKAYVVNQFGEGSKEALDFGFPPPRPGKKSPEEKARAVLLAKATREARHPIGPKKRLEIKGKIEDLPEPSEKSSSLS
jgi:hypothetical protein